MAKKTATKTKKPDAEIKMYVISALMSKKGARDLLYGEEKEQPRQFSQVTSLEAAIGIMKSWEGQSHYYRDVRLHEIAEGKKVRIKTEIVEE